MKAGFRQSMAWLHTWTGLIVGWVLYFIFLTGTAGYFDNEITRWMQPERPLAVGETDDLSLLAGVQAHMARAEPDALQWSLYFPGHEPLDPEVWWSTPGAAGGVDWKSGTFDPASGRMLARGEAAARATGGGVDLYRLHYDLHYMSRYVANMIVGVCSMLMLIAILTGVVTHKKIFKDFFTFRPAKGQRSWLDAHNLLSVTALPFFLMITLSGLMFFMYLYLPAGMHAAYGTGRQWDGDGYVNPLNPRANSGFDPQRVSFEASPASGALAPIIDLRGPLGIAQSRWGARSVDWIEVHHPGDAAAEVRIVREGRNITQREDLRFSGVSGEELAPTPQRRGAAWWVQDVFIDLHEGLFAGWVLRWLYFLSGLLGAAMIATGLILWTVKRRPRQGGGLGFRLVEKLNIGAVAGLPIGFAAYFWANRVLPVDLGNRASWEMHGLFLTWGATFLWAFIRPSAKAWSETLWFAAAAFGLLPALNVLTTERHLAVTIPSGAWGLAGFDLTVLALGALFAVAAIKARARSTPAVAPPRRRVEAPI